MRKFIIPIAATVLAFLLLLFCLLPIFCISMDWSYSSYSSTTSYSINAKFSIAQIMTKRAQNAKLVTRMTQNGVEERRVEFINALRYVTLNAPDVYATILRIASTILFILVAITFLLAGISLIPTVNYHMKSVRDGLLITASAVYIVEVAIIAIVRAVLISNQSSYSSSDYGVLKSGGIVTTIILIVLCLISYLIFQKVLDTSPYEPTKKEKGTTFFNSLGESKRIELLMKYKELLDAGVLTQEDFDRKKAELMK